jgi:hypothetical protein
MQAKLQVYTSLFDIGRDQVDNRSMANYKSWLVATIKLFPGIIVFHDGSCDGLVIKDSHLIKVKKNNLEFFKLLPSVNQIFKTFSPQSPNDVTFKLPEYSLVQYSKFDLALRTLEISGAESVLWVDAGISRFIDTIDSNLLEINAGKLLTVGFDFMFEINLRKNINFKKLKIKSPIPGSCGRVISGGAFWIRRNSAQRLADEIKDLLNTWISNFVWDNEQVALRTLFELPNNLNSCHFVLQNHAKPGSVARKLGNAKLNTNKSIDKLIRKMLIS